MKDILAGAGLLAFVATLCSYFYKWGEKDGYAKGRKAADDWWIGAEQQANQAREQIWREENQRP